jgi:1-deoxy-D-xylulose-5-phosphate reductoisomerase
MVQFRDGTIMANIGPKSMQIPIAYALSYPKRLENNIEKLDLFDIYDLKFEKPDPEKFPCLRLAYKAIEKGHSAQVVLNAANEVLVSAFLEGRVKYTDIPKVIEKMMDIFPVRTLCDVASILDFDKEVREKTLEYIQ